MGNIRKILFCALAVLGAASQAQADNCQLVQIASLDSKIDSAGGLTVPATIQGHDKYLLIDTAGVYNLMTSAAIDDIGLSRVASNPDLRMALFSGKLLTKVAVVHQFRLGDLVGGRLYFLEIPNEQISKEDAGTLGPSALANYDIEIDPAGKKVKLFSQDHCPGHVIYWTRQPAAAIPFRLDTYLHIIIPVLLDGKIVEATVDTGSSITLLLDGAAHSIFNIDKDTKGVTPWVTDKTDNGTYRYPFKALSFEGVGVENPEIAIMPDNDPQGEKTPVTLGMTTLRHLHFFISYKERMLYATAADAH